MTMTIEKITAAYPSVAKLESKAGQELLAVMMEQMGKLAAELMSVKAMNDCLSEELRGYESDGAFEGPKMHLLWWQCETPIHDTFQAELRAQGVEMLADHLSGMNISASETSVREFAAQLREAK